MAATAQHPALSGIDALEISAHIQSVDPDLGQALQREAGAAEHDLANELPAVDGSPNLYLISQDELHAIVSRGVMIGAGVVVHQVGSRMRNGVGTGEFPALDVQTAS